MKTFVLTDVDKTFNVEVITDAPENVVDPGNFTVMEVRGSDTLSLALPKGVIMSLQDLKDIALTHSLKLESFTSQSVSSTTVVDDTPYYGGPLGEDNI